MSDQNCGNSVQRTYTVEQISKILGISLRKTYYLCEHTTDFKVIRLGKRCLRIHKESFDSWFNALDRIHKATSKKGTVMATYTIRGTSHNVVYTYKAADGKRKQQWESYSSELEAIQRKAYIDYLQSQNRTSDITHEASEYRRKKAVEKAAQKIAAEKTATAPDTPSPESEDNMSKTYREFMERFLPIHARREFLT